MSLREGQKRLRGIALALKNGKNLTDAERTWLATALARIADGEEAEAALLVKAKRGERKGKNAQEREEIAQLAMGWIAASMEPHEDGRPGLTLEVACATIANKFGLTEESLRDLWNKNPDMRNVVFEGRQSGGLK